MKKQIRFVAILFFCILLVACGQASNEPNDDTKNNALQQSESEGDNMEITYERITQKEAKQLMADEEGYIILDVRTQDEYASGHIPGAICVPNETIDGEMPAELPEKSQLILVYCRSGNRSKQASQKLVELGYTNVKEFGGIMDWDGEIVQ